MYAESPGAGGVPGAGPVVVDGAALRRALLGSYSWVAAHQEQINHLNVFPVPDGDTGTNMLLTLKAAVEDVKDSAATDVGRVAAIAAHGSLMGARGNSGVILSQLFRGFAKALQGKEQVTPLELAIGFQEAANAAYRAVNKPTEGTILTVAREAGRAAAEAASSPGATVTGVLEAAVAAARLAVERTPTQLAVLRDAGVVDAGGYGLQVLLEGFLRNIGGEVPVPSGVSVNGGRVAQTALELPEEGWGYCTEFLIIGAKVPVEAIRERIAAMGNSVLVVGDETVTKVHVHTNDPADVLAYAHTLGRLDRINVGDMSDQHRSLREAAAPSAAASVLTAGRANAVGIVAVVAGDGLAAVFRDLGADQIVEGGQTMNPSTQDMLEGVERVPYDDVILLPNNGNVIMSANQVRGLSQKTVHVLETRSAPEGIEALVAFNPELSATDNLAAMREAISQVRTLEITHAVRDSQTDGVTVRSGDVIALIDDQLRFAGNDYVEVLDRALTSLEGDGLELITIYTGSGVEPAEVERLVAAIRSGHPTLEVEVHEGGQLHYPFIVSAI